MPVNGLFITFEGVDGAGKSTQARILQQNLHDKGYKTLLTREPGGPVGGERIRQLLIEKSEFKWSALTEVLLFFAARNDHVEKMIRPALSEGRIVICDRFTDSTRIYQGRASADHAAIIDSLQKHVIRLDPDLTFILAIDSEEAIARTQERSDEDWRLSQLSRDEIREIILRFGCLQAEYPKRCRVVQALRRPHEVAQQILTLTLDRLSERIA